MTEIKLPYESWNRFNDVPLHRPGTDYAFGLVNSSIQLGHGLTRREDLRDGAVAEVAGLLAGCKEWLRQYGMTADEVANMVRSFEEKNRGSNAQQFEKEALRLRYIDQKPVDEITTERIRTLN